MNTINFIIRAGPWEQVLYVIMQIKATPLISQDANLCHACLNFEFENFISLMGPFLYAFSEMQTEVKQNKTKPVLSCQ